MIREIQAKTILSNNKRPSAWFGVMYLLNIYRGCQHGCIYCDSRSECYRIDNFDDITVKTNAAELLRQEISRKRKKGTVGTGAMSDPYTPIEKEYKLTQRTLQIIAEERFPLHITTKSNLILRDIDILQEISKIYATVAFTVTTVDDDLARKIEPGAPLPSERLKAMGVLAALGISVGITMMPVLPFIGDDQENISGIVKAAKHYGAQFIYPFFGMTLRDRQRDYYYQKLDKVFPGLTEKYRQKYDLRYSCAAGNAHKLHEVFKEACHKSSISTKMPSYAAAANDLQLSLFSN